MREAFHVSMDEANHSLVLAWNPQKYSFAIGNKGKVLIVDNTGKVIKTFEMNAKSHITSLDWNKEGSTLAILQVREFLIFCLMDFLSMLLCNTL